MFFNKFIILKNFIIATTIKQIVKILDFIYHYDNYLFLNEQFSWCSEKPYLIIIKQIIININWIRFKNSYDSSFMIMLGNN